MSLDAGQNPAATMSPFVLEIDAIALTDDEQLGPRGGRWHRDVAMLQQFPAKDVLAFAPVRLCHWVKPPCLVRQTALIWMDEA